MTLIFTRFTVAGRCDDLHRDGRVLTPATLPEHAQAQCSRLVSVAMHCWGSIRMETVFLTTSFDYQQVEWTRYLNKDF